MSWTVKILKEHFDCRLKAMGKALKLARKNVNVRLKGMNEVRAQLDRQVRTFVTKDEFSGEIKLVNTKIDSISKLVYVGFGVWIVLQAILTVILVLIFKK